VLLGEGAEAALPASPKEIFRKKVVATTYSGAVQGDFSPF